MFLQQKLTQEYEGTVKKEKYDTFKKGIIKTSLLE